VKSWVSGFGIGGRLRDGEKMATQCRECDISRKTGYKISQRHKDIGPGSRTRRPVRGERFDHVEMELMDNLHMRALQSVERDRSSVMFRM
jgi:hypothetical protein